MSVTMGLTTIGLTKSLAIARASGGLTSGLLAAWFGERSTRVPVDPLNGDPSAIESGEPDFRMGRQNSDSTTFDDEAIGCLLDAIDSALDLTECSAVEEWRQVTERVRATLIRIQLTTRNFDLSNLVGEQDEKLVARGIVE